MSFTVIEEEKKLHPILSDIYRPLHKKKRVIVICGPTATGKSDLALCLAEVLGGEIVSADSMQVYKKMDIGTAKVTSQVRQEIPHHLIDICDLAEPFNVAQFCKAANQAIDQILSRGNVPIIVGGTGFYVHSLIYGAPSGPPSDPTIRKELEEQMEKFGPEPLYDKLNSLDPVYAKSITEKDKHKIIRALEIIRLTQQKVSDLSKQDQKQMNRYDFRCWFIYYPKELLHDRIEYRCDQMIKEGFIEEVKKIQSDLLKNSSARQSIGYKQCLEYLNTEQTQTDFEHFMQAFKKASKQYAKRQFTWFRKEPFFKWVNLQDLDLEYVKELILQDFEIGH